VIAGLFVVSERAIMSVSGRSSLIHVFEFAVFPDIIAAAPTDSAEHADDTDTQRSALQRREVRRKA